MNLQSGVKTMSTGKYKIFTEKYGDVFVGLHESTKEEALKYFLNNYDVIKKDILSIKISDAHKARKIYIKSIREADGDLDSAAIIANKKGYNRTCDYQDEWYEAIKLA